MRGFNQRVGVERSKVGPVSIPGGSQNMETRSDKVLGPGAHISSKSSPLDDGFAPPGARRAKTDVRGVHDASGMVRVRGARDSPSCSTRARHLNAVHLSDPANHEFLLAQRSAKGARPSAHRER